MLHFLAIAAASAAGVQGGATVSSAARIGTAGCLESPSGCEWMDQRDAAVFSPWVRARPDDRLHAEARLNFRLHGPSTAARMESLQTPHQDWSMRIQDAWIATEGEHLDTRFGAQRVAWGVANGISVVDTINPLDLEDPTRFDQRLSTVSMLMTAHGGSLSATGVVVPFFVPAALPTSEVQLMAGAQDVFESGELDVDTLQTRADPPKNALGDTSVAAQVRWTPTLVDLALSWYHGRDSLPQVSGEVLLIGYQTQTGRVDVGIPLVYPNLDVAGLTARGELPGELTGWAEAAWVMPQRTVAAPSAAQLNSLVQLGTLDEVPDPLPQTVTQDGQPFARWIIGAERELGPVRLSTQWLHGFFTERSSADIRDYGLLSARWSISPTLRVDASGASDLDGWLSDAAVVWLAADALELTLGATYIGGPSTSALGGLSSSSGLRLKGQLIF
jgi:hypothetical protein